MELKKYFLVLICALLTGCTNKSTRKGIELLKQNLINDALDLGFRPRTDRYIVSDYSKASEYLKTIEKDGSWSDIDYLDEDNNWAPLKHLNRILVMTIKYAQDTSSQYKNQEVLRGLERSIQYWYTVNPTCRNWYKNDIAKQFYFNIIGLLLQNEIDQSLHQSIVNDLTATPTMTGSNRTLVASSTIYRGVLENNPDRIKKGVMGVTDQIKVTAKEGIQPDYSFHQHGHFIYNGSYGHNFLRESIWLATMVHGTGFDFTAEQIKTLRDYYLEGTRWMLRGGLFDYNVRGRQVGRPEGDVLLGDKIIPQLDQYIIADPEYRNEYLKSKNQILSLKPQLISGNRHFWRSDYTVHHRDTYMTSLKMCSERTVGIELNMNQENKLGYWLPYGLTYIYRRGNEYQGIFPAWDWARLPGITNPYYEYEERGKGVAYTQKTSFVGGVSNGTYGVSSMHFHVDSTKAKKSWFWFDDEWVALGADIESTSKFPIVTGINQCHLVDRVIIDGKSYKGQAQAKIIPQWITHDGISYIFPNKAPVMIKTGVQQGKLKRIYGLAADTLYTPNVFSLWFDHGIAPSAATYSYIVAPGIPTNELGNYVDSPPVHILSNTSEIQAVLHENLKMVGVAFHQKGGLEIQDDLRVNVDAPCLILFDYKKDLISICDPTAKLKTIKIDIKRNDVTKHESVLLPKAEFAGKSVTVDLS